MYQNSWNSSNEVMDDMMNLKNDTLITDLLPFFNIEFQLLIEDLGIVT